MDGFLINSTSQARTSANTLSSDASYYASLSQELRNIETQIKANWEGNSNDINDIVTRIDSVCFDIDGKIVPALKDLSTSIVSLSNEIDATANQTIDSNNGGNTSNNSNGGFDNTKYAGPPAPSNLPKPDEPSAPSDLPKSEEAESDSVGFWQYHGNDFANDWDYSGCDSALDYIGSTLGGVFATAGSSVNFIVDGTSELLGFLFG